ncbi:MAG TPA: pteridine-dependent deoxygenase [Xanthomonadaceae bacterium]|nr:pteridine-dependent deoxygenase [Xanthomonadaceae bacterium]
MSAHDPRVRRDGTGAALHVGYVEASLDALLADPALLAVIGFGSRAPSAHPDPRYFNAGLDVLGETAPFEVWRGGGQVECGRHGNVAWSCDGELCFGAIEIGEEEHGGPAGVAEVAYRQMLEFVSGTAQPHLLRVWNVLDAINQGAGDDERYRQFCLGRARGMQGRIEAYPAATAVGVNDGRRRLRIYFLAGREPGTHIENPRQVAAWRYPRAYGPQPPSFSRATLPASHDVPLLLSGTASVVGHATLHADDVALQVGETLSNLASLLLTAHHMRPALPLGLGAGSLLKVYVRDPAEVAAIAAVLERHIPAALPRLLLHADICRADLRMEIDGFHG